MLGLRKFMWGKSTVVENVIYLWGRGSNAFINLMLSVLLSNNIYFIFIFKQSPTDWQGWLWHHLCPIGPQSPCDWRYLIFYVQFLISTKIFSFTRWHFISMFARLYTCIVQSAQQKGCVWWPVWNSNLF